MSNFPDGNRGLAEEFTSATQRIVTEISGNPTGTPVTEYLPLFNDGLQLVEFLRDAKEHYNWGAERLAFETRSMLGPMWNAPDKRRPLVPPGEGIIVTSLRTIRIGAGFIIGRLVDEETMLDMPLAVSATGMIYGKREPRFGVIEIDHSKRQNIFAHGRSFGRGYGAPLETFYDAQFQPGTYTRKSFGIAPGKDGFPPSYQIFVPAKSGSVDEVLDMHRKNLTPVPKKSRNQKR